MTTLMMQEGMPTLRRVGVTDLGTRIFIETTAGGRLLTTMDLKNLAHHKRATRLLDSLHE